MLAASIAAAGLAVLMSVAPAAGPVADPAAVTATTLAVIAGPTGTPTVNVQVTAPDQPVTGHVTVRDGDRPIAVLPVEAGVASLSTTALAGHHVVTAEFHGDTVFAGSVSDRVTIGSPGQAEAGNVGVVIPAGSLGLTTMSGPGGDSRVRVTDTRAGDLGFVVSATAEGRGRPGSTISLVTEAVHVHGNALRAEDLEHSAHRLSLPAGRTRVVAVYPAARGTGSVDIAWGVRGPGGHGRAPVRVVWTVM